MIISQEWEIELAYVTSVTQDGLKKSTIYWKEIDHEVGISLILFHDIRKYTLCFFSILKSKYLISHLGENGGDLVICHFPGLKVS